MSDAQFGLPWQSPPARQVVIEHYGFRTATRLQWATIAEWITLCETVDRTERCSTPWKARTEALHRSLTIEDIRSCTNVAVLRRLERRFDRNGLQRGDWPGRWPLWRTLERGEIGERLVEIRNRIAALRSGRAFKPRPKGPRLDPSRLPDAALDRLIQQHRDIAVVERLRIERRRRFEALQHQADVAHG